MSAAIWDLKMIARIDVFPDPDFPIKSTSNRPVSTAQRWSESPQRVFTFFRVDLADIFVVEDKMHSNFLL